MPGARSKKRSLLLRSWSAHLACPSGCGAGGGRHGDEEAPLRRDLLQGSPPPPLSPVPSPEEANRDGKPPPPLRAVGLQRSPPPPPPPPPRPRASRRAAHGGGLASPLASGRPLRRGSLLQLCSGCSTQHAVSARVAPSGSTEHARGAEPACSAKARQGKLTAFRRRSPWEPGGDRGRGQLIWVEPSPNEVRSRSLLASAQHSTQQRLPPPPARLLACLGINRRQQREPRRAL